MRAVLEFRISAGYFHDESITQQYLSCEIYNKLYSENTKLLFIVHVRE